MHRRGEQALEVHPEFKQVGKDKVIGSAQLLGADGRRSESFHVITFREGKIIDMQDCTSLRAAERFARRHSRS